MVCALIPSMLDNLPRDDEGKCPIKVGFLTYGHTISFFNLSEELSQPQMMVTKNNFFFLRNFKFMSLGCRRC